MHSPIKRASLLAALVALSASSLEASAQAVARFDFPAQPLVESLRAVASQTQFNVFFEPKLVAGRQAPALKAQLTTEDALRELLKGTGLTYQLIDDKTFKIVSARADAVSSASAAYQPIAAQWSGAQTETTSETARSSLDVINEVVVTGKIDFSENDAFGATKMGLSILDTPQTITVITSDMMEVMNIRNLDDVNRVLPGSSRTHDFQGGENFYFRGFQNDQGNTLRMDGFRYYSSTKLPPLLFDRIEVIQGATSTVYGQNNPAGTINVVSKVPEKEFALRMRADAGSNDYYSGDVDVTGPLGGSNWAYRLLAGVDQYGTQYDYSHDDKIVGAATLQYQDDTRKFFVRLSHHERDATAMRTSYFQFDRPLPAGSVAAALAGGLVDIIPLDGVPRSRYLGMPWGYQDAEVDAVQAQFDYSFGNDWVVRAHYQNTDETTGFGLFEVLGPINSAGSGLRERLMSNAWDTSSYGMEMNLFGPFQALGREHTLFFGVDYSSIEYFSRTNSGFYGNNYAGTRFNVFAPNYSAYSRDDLRTFAGAASTNRNRFSEELVYSGAVAQVVLNPIDRLSVLLGARYSYDTVKSRLVASNNVSDEQIDALTAAALPTYQQHKNSIGQVGVTYEIFDKVNLYASYGETFTPTSERVYQEGLANGGEVGSQDGYNVEVGIKMEVDKWNARLTAFDARRTNITQADAAHPGFVLAIGEQIGRGVESVVQGQMLPRLNVFAGVTYLDAEYTEGEFAGMRPPSAPDLSLSLFSTYEFDSFLPGFGAGLGVTHKRGLQAPDRAYRDVDGGVYTVDLGNITEVDARLFYALGNWDFYLVASNLFDERYVTASNTSLNSNAHINPGREVRIGMKYRLGAKSR